MTFLQANLPSLNWSVTDPGHAHTLNDSSGAGGVVTGSTGSIRNPGSANGGNFTSLSVASNTTGISVASGGSGTAVKIVQPTIAGTWYICL